MAIIILYTNLIKGKKKVFALVSTSSTSDAVVHLSNWNDFSESQRCLGQKRQEVIPFFVCLVCIIDGSILDRTFQPIYHQMAVRKFRLIQN